MLFVVYCMITNVSRFTCPFLDEFSHDIPVVITTVEFHCSDAFESPLQLSKRKIHVFERAVSLLFSKVFDAERMSINFDDFQSSNS